MNYFEEFRDFPQEDILWIVEKALATDDDSESEDDDEIQDANDESYLLSVADKQDSFIGAKSISKEQSLDTGLIELIKDCCSLPLSGKPRKPTFIHIPWKLNDPVKQSLIAIRINVSDGTSYLPQVVSTKNKLWRVCSFCGRRGDLKLFEKCSTCSAVFHCNVQCEKKSLSQKGQHSHTDWCQKMKSYMCNSDKLADFPFLFSRETTSSDFGPQQLYQFIKRLGLLDHPLWAREISPSTPNAVPFGELTWDNVSDISDPIPDSFQGNLQTWMKYYELRHISLDNPVAAILSNVITSYHIISSFLSNYKKSSLLLHLVGCEKEADELKLFKELEYLLPNHKLHVVMIGPHISSKCHKYSSTSGQVIVTLHRGQYHKLQLETPDLLIGFNAGLAAYQSWPDTLKLLKEKNICSFFTDYCRYSCEASRLCVESLGVGTISEPSINPFRSPLRKYCEEHCMPWYSNAFIYQLLYRE